MRGGSTWLWAVVLSLLFSCVEGTHFRYGVITWRRWKKNNTERLLDAFYFRFRCVTVWDSDFAVEPFPEIRGQPAGTPFPYLKITGGGFFHGDNTSQPWAGEVCYNSVNTNDVIDPSQPEKNLLYIECIFFHEYEYASLYEAYFLSCCRITTLDRLRNNAELQTRVSVKVVVDNVITDSLVSSWLPISPVPLYEGNDIAYQQFIAFDPFGFPIEFTHSDTFTMSGYPHRSPISPDSFPPEYWTIGLDTGLVAWFNATMLLHGDYYNAQIYVQHEPSNRTVVVDFLYLIEIIPLFCLGVSQGGCPFTHTYNCTSDLNCTHPGCEPTQGVCAFPGVPEFIDPTPPHGAILVHYATQTETYGIVANRTGPHCCEFGEYVWFIEGPYPLGFRDNKAEFGSNPHVGMYTWTPLVEQAGLHQLCWGACAANDELFGFFPVCSAPHCFAIFVSLKPNGPPVITVPEDVFSEFGFIAFHLTWRYITDMYVTDDSGTNDVECWITVRVGYMELGHFPQGLRFLNGTNGTYTQHMELFGTLEEINFAMFKMKYIGPEGTDRMQVWVNDHTHSGIGQGEPYTHLYDLEEFPIRILPACNNECPDNLVILTALYEDTRGQSWEVNTNWMSGDPCWDYWHGVNCINGEVVSIILPHNNLTGTLPCLLGCLHSLRKMYFMGNNLVGLIPPKFGELTCLEDLSLFNNQLEWTIPTEFGTMRSLERIQVNDNVLVGTIPTELGVLTNLRELLLQNNKIRGTVPDELWNLPGLNYNWIYNNDISFVPPSWAQERFYREDELERVGRENRM